MKRLAQLLPQSGPTILHTLCSCQKRGLVGGAKRTSLREPFFYFIHTHVGLCLKCVCVYVSVPGCVYMAGTCVHRRSSIPLPPPSPVRPLLTCPNVYQSGAARGPPLRRAPQNKRTSIGFEWLDAGDSRLLSCQRYILCAWNRFRDEKK